jgi:hypothetical protein
VHSLLLLHLALRIGSGRREKKVAVVPGPVGRAAPPGTVGPVKGKIIETRRERVTLEYMIVCFPI